MNRQKRIAAIHDISGIGKCSLTVAIPIISAAGIETAVIPTAVLSTHTGGLSGYTFRDLSDDLVPIAKHWSSLKLSFDAIYTGFLGSKEQIDSVLEIIDMLADENTLVMVDPVMGDNGRLYKTFDIDFVEQMKRLCKRADILTPNITEACLLTDSEYGEIFGKANSTDILHTKLQSLCGGDIVITGAESGGAVGAVYYEKSKNIYRAYSDKVEGMYHGTGDVFTSTLLAAIMSGASKQKSIETAVGFTHNAILRTKNAGTDTRFGVQFERELPYLIKQLGLI